MGVQYEHKYQIGEKVKIVKTKTVKHWNAAMDKYVGMVATVVGYFEECYELDVDNQMWYWWPDMLTDYTVSVPMQAKFGVQKVLDDFDKESGVFFKAFCESNVCDTCPLKAAFTDNRGQTCPLLIVPDLLKHMGNVAKKLEEDSKEAKQPKELSVAEIEKLLGYPVKVVKGE